MKDAEEPQQNNDRNRDTDQPEENTAHRGFLLFAGAPPHKRVDKSEVPVTTGTPTPIAV